MELGSNVCDGLLTFMTVLLILSPSLADQIVGIFFFYCIELNSTFCYKRKRGDNYIRKSPYSLSLSLSLKISPHRCCCCRPINVVVVVLFFVILYNNFLNYDLKEKKKKTKTMSFCSFNGDT